MSLTQGNDPGWTSFSDYEMTTKFNSQPSSAFKMNFIAQILLLWAWHHTCTLLRLLPMSKNLGWIMWIMDRNKYFIIGAVICYEYSNIWCLHFIIGNTQNNCFRWQKWFLQLYICFSLPYNQIIKRNNQIIKTNSHIQNNKCVDLDLSEVIRRWQ